MIERRPYTRLFVILVSATVGGCYPYCFGIPRSAYLCGVEDAGNATDSDAEITETAQRLVKTCDLKTTEKEFSTLLGSSGTRPATSRLVKVPYLDSRDENWDDPLPAVVCSEARTPVVSNKPTVFSKQVPPKRASVVSPPEKRQSAVFQSPSVPRPSQRDDSWRMTSVLLIIACMAIALATGKENMRIFK